MSSAAPNVAPAPVDGPVDAVVSKVQKHLDLLKSKNAKLAEENSKLRAQLAEARSSNSRIRRIPKALPA